MAIIEAPLEFVRPSSLSRSPQLNARLDWVVDEINRTRTAKLRDAYSPIAATIKVDQCANEIHNKILDNLRSAETAEKYIIAPADLVRLVKDLSLGIKTADGTAHIHRLDQLPPETIARYTRLALATRPTTDLDLAYRDYVTRRAQAQYLEDLVGLFEQLVGHNVLDPAQLENQLAKLQSALDARISQLPPPS